MRPCEKGTDDFDHIDRFSEGRADPSQKVVHQQGSDSTGQQVAERCFQTGHIYNYRCFCQSASPAFSGLADVSSYKYLLIKEWDQFFLFHL